VFHVAGVEDFWIHQDVRHKQPALKTTPTLRDTQGGPAHTGCALGTLLDYWRAVEQSTLTYLAALTDDGLRRIVIVHDSPAERFTVDGSLCHVMIHKVRHIAQTAVFLGTQGISRLLLTRGFTCHLLDYHSVPLLARVTKIPIRDEADRAMSREVFADGDGLKSSDFEMSDDMSSSDWLLPDASAVIQD
jgi:uncharacterized damage-inducible protein DinB